MDDTSKRWNPRWVAFARSQGRTPAEQIAHDWGPRGCQGAAFVCWNRDRIREWATATGRTRLLDPNECLLSGDHAAYNAWLAERWPADG